MRDIWAEQLNWVDSGKPFVLARVIRTWRSAPRKSPEQECSLEKEWTKIRCQK